MTTKPTPQQRRRAQYERLVASLAVPQHTTIRTTTPGKAKPGVGRSATV